MHKKDTLTVATYNIEFSKHVDMLLANSKLLQKKGVSVLCLQEVMRYDNIEFIVDRLLQTLGRHWKAEYIIGENDTLTDHGVAILWDGKKLKLQQIQTLVLPRLPRLTILESFLTFFFTLTHSPRQIDRKAIIGTFKYKNILLRIASLHLDLAGGIQQRNRQATFFLDHLEKDSKVDKEIVCGDFNTVIKTPRQNEKMIMQNVFKQYAFTDVTHHIAWSCDAMQTTFKDNYMFISKIIRTLRLSTKQKLDYIWSKNMEVVSSEQLDVPGSDHRPLIATLQTT